jgi:hypothetical protein
MPLPVVEALLALAEVLKLAGADGEARVLAQEAVEVAERKGDRVGAAAAAALA